MICILGNKNNIYTAAFDATAKTITISNCINFDLELHSLNSVYNTTRSLPFVIDAATTLTKATVAGLVTWIYTFAAVPAASANGDTLIILLDIPQSQAEYSILQVIAGATI